MAIQKVSSFQNVDPQVGALYLVPTPIGNLNDMTPRAVETLKQADFIAAEDTRNTQKLLNHFDIHTKQISFHKFNTQERIPELIAMLKDGKNIAQVSDAGMPSISDPGHELVEACAAEEIRVIALPGPSASLTALIASGLVPQPFLFYGFLPRKKAEQVAILEKLNSQTVTMIFYEAPHRLNKTLPLILKMLSGAVIDVSRLSTNKQRKLYGSIVQNLKSIIGHFSEYRRELSKAMRLNLRRLQELVFIVTYCGIHLRRF